jgi:hypothetical protein
VNWAAALEPSVSSPPGVMPVPVVATYASARDKKSEVNSNPKDSSAWLAAKAGATLSVATPKWPARRAVLGVVTSSMSNATEHQASESRWHTVAMAREGNTVWVHDPDYSLANKYASSSPNYRRRVALVPGISMVKALIDQWPGVDGIWLQGPPTTFAQGQQQCMGRSALWVEHTLQGTAPWPPNTPSLGGTWTFHYKN